jgi:hypothetical protein
MVREECFDALIACPTDVASCGRHIENFYDVARVKLAFLTVARLDPAHASTECNEALGSRVVKELVLSVVNTPTRREHYELSSRRRLKRGLPIRRRRSYGRLQRELYFHVPKMCFLVGAHV